MVAIALLAAACGQGQPQGHRPAASPAPGGSPPASPTPLTAVSSTPGGSPTTLTIAEVYRRAAQALDRPGLLYHATIERNATTAGTLDPWGLGASTTEQWVDGRRGVARTETRRAQDSWTTIVTPAEQYSLTRPND